MYVQSFAGRHTLKVVTGLLDMYFVAQQWTEVERTMSEQGTDLEVKKGRERKNYRLKLRNDLTS